MPGAVHTFTHTSEVLKGNRCGDPHERLVRLYTPPGYELGAGGPLPLVWFIYGYTGYPSKLFEVNPWGENLPQQLDRLIDSGALPPCAVAIPDCWTKWGGSQYVNSSATGNYEDYLVKELHPFVSAKLPVSGHAIVGKSSGGIGSFWLAARHPELWQAAADHSGDAYFEYCYLVDFPKVVAILRKFGGFDKFLEAFRKAPRKGESQWMTVMNLACMSACYAPNPAAPHGFDWPMDLETGEIRGEVFGKFFAFDPVRVAAQYADNLKKLKLLFIDCGEQDEFHLQWGARILGKRLAAAGVKHELEFFDDGHMGITYRYDVSLPKLVNALLGR